MRHDPDAPALVLSPHFDDAVLSCWSSIAGDDPLTIVNVFGGEPHPGYATWWDQLCGHDSSLDAVRVRREEDAAALALAGRTAVTLDLLPTQYTLRASRTLHALLRRVPALRWRAARLPLLARWVLERPAATVEDVLAAVARHVGAVSTVWAPAGIGSHPDHVVVRGAALALADTAIPVRLYADVPYCVQHGWPSWVTGAAPDEEHDRRVHAHWRAGLDPLEARLGGQRAARCVPLDAAQQVQKRAAVRAYASQLGELLRTCPELLAEQGSERRPAAPLAWELSWSLDGAPE